MSALPGDIDAEAGPPMTVPLRHFVVALGFLVAGVAVGLVSGRAGHLAQIHLLLAGWVCLTILGAMTQFVPVWAGVELHSRRLAALQLPLAAVGFAGLAVGFLSRAEALLPVAGGLAVLGVWVFCYNLARTLWHADLDVTTGLFGVALGFFFLVTVAGGGLALDRTVGLLPVAGVSRTTLLTGHATLAVFGAVLTTVTGALAQLVPMFTQADTGRLVTVTERAAAVGYPLGVVLLAGGRLFAHPTVARAGGLLVVAGLATVGLVLARRLLGATVDWSPMLTRYAVVAVSVVCWAPLAALTWWRDPLGYAGLFGHSATGSLLLVGVVGFVVLGTLYHVVPFIVWVHRYSDRLGFEDVPMIDDLYDGRIAAGDATALTAAGGLALGHETGVLPGIAATAAGTMAAVGAVLFAANLVSVLLTHGPQSMPELLGGRLAHAWDR
ncbi:hypothetical protein [Haloarcula montana]|uniref:hypothetical protein n=1 Tax=Haloarcula montana TaxID=3111776 RepID=UPI002D79B82B|nr:hypothetical protein [Haloarcula sp. GH36]